MSYSTKNVRQQIHWDHVRAQYETVKKLHPEKVAGMSLEDFNVRYGALIAQHTEETAAHVGKELVNNPVLPVHEEFHFDRHTDQVINVLGFGRGGSDYTATVGDVIKSIRESGRHVGDRLARLVADVREYSLDNELALKVKMQSLALQLFRGLSFKVTSGADLDNVIDMLTRLEENLVIVHEKAAILSPGDRSRIKNTVAENAFANGKDIKDHILELTRVDSVGEKTFVPFAVLFPIVVASRIRHQLSEAQFKAFYAILAGIVAAASRPGAGDDGASVPIVYPREFKQRYMEIVRDDHRAYWERLRDTNLRDGTVVYYDEAPVPPERREEAAIEGQGDVGPTAAAAVLAMVQKDIATVTADKAAEKAFVAASQVAAFLKSTESTPAAVRSQAKLINAGVQRAARVNKFADDTKDMRGVITDLLHGKHATPTQFDVDTTLRSDFVRQVIEPHIEKVVPSSSAGGAGTLIMLAPANVTARTIDVWNKADAAEKAQYFAAHLVKSAAGSKIHTADGSVYTIDGARSLLIKAPLTEGAPSRALNLHLPIEKEVAGGHTLVVLPISGELVSSRLLMKAATQSVDASAVDKAKEKAAAARKKVKDALSKKAKQEIQIVEKDLKSGTADRAQLTRDLDDLDGFIATFKTIKSEHPEEFSEQNARQLAEMEAERKKVLAQLRQVAAKFTEQLVAKAVAAVDAPVAAAAVGAPLSGVSDEELKSRWATLKNQWNQSTAEPHLPTYYKQLRAKISPVFAELMKRRLAVAADFTLMVAVDKGLGGEAAQAAPVECDTCGGKKKKSDEAAQGGGAALALVGCDTCGGKKKKKSGEAALSSASAADKSMALAFKTAAAAAAAGSAAGTSIPVAANFPPSTVEEAEERLRSVERAEQRQRDEIIARADPTPTEEDTRWLNYFAKQKRELEKTIHRLQLEAQVPASDRVEPRTAEGYEAAILDVEQRFKKLADEVLGRPDQLPTKDELFWLRHLYDRKHHLKHGLYGLSVPDGFFGGPVTIESAVEQMRVVEKFTKDLQDEIRSRADPEPTEEDLYWIEFYAKEKERLSEAIKYLQGRKDPEWIGARVGDFAAHTQWPFNRSQKARLQTPTDYLVNLLGNNRDRTFFLSGGTGFYIGAGQLLRTSQKLLEYLGNNITVKYGLVKNYQPTDEAPELRVYVDDLSGRVKVGWGSDERIQQIFAIAPRNLGSYVYFELSTTAKTPNDKLVWPAMSGSTSLVVSALPALVPLLTEESTDLGDDIDDILAEMSERSRKH